MDRWTRLGIEAYRTGNREQAQRFFHYALMENPNDIRTWLWLVEVSENDAEKQHSLTRVLALDPSHVLARRALEEVDARLADKNGRRTGPFESDTVPGSEPARQNASIEIRSTPPFIENLAQQARTKSETVLPTQARTVARRVRLWIMIPLVLIGLLVVFLLAGWALHLI